MAKAKKDVPAKALEVAKPTEAKQPRKKQAPPVHMYCQCLADPEGSPACRIPDEYVVPSVAQKLTQEYVVVTDAGGNFFTMVSPALSRAVYSASVDAAGVVGAITYAAHPDHAALSAEFLYGRPVTHQVSVSYIGSAQLAAGRIAIVQDSNQGAYAAGANISTMFDDDWSGPAAGGGFARARPREIARMVDISTPTWGVPSFDAVFIVGTGIPAGTNICVRVTRHIELIPQRKSTWRGVAQIEPFHPTAMAQATNMGPAGTVGAIAQRQEKSTLAVQAAKAAWNYVKSDVMEVGGFVAAAAYEAGNAPLLALMAA